MSEREAASYRLCLSIPAQPESVAVARSLVRSLPYASDEQLADVELIVSELVTNTIRHDSLHADDVIEIELESLPSFVRGFVRYASVPFTGPDTAQHLGDGTGFGLLITRELADSMTTARSSSGVEVCFTVASRPR